VTSLRAAVLADLPKPTRPPGQVSRTIDRVLARPEYRHPGPSFLERIQHDVLDWIARALTGVVGAGLGAWIALALILALVALVVWRLVGGVSRDPGQGVAVSAGRLRPAADWRAEAEAHERAGEWRQAVRARYRALVADLAGRGFLQEIPGRTAGEYRAELGDALPAASTQFAGATELFEGAWYGRRPTDAADAAHLRQLSDRVLEVAR
jgi:Domain of unknown function (DUF4129)